MSAPRAIGAGDNGVDVAVFQSDLNRCLAVLGAPPNTLLSRDGVFGGETALMVASIARALGLSLSEASAGPVVGVRERAVIRHWAKWVQGRRRAEDYEIPAFAARTEEEVSRGNPAATNGSVVLGDLVAGPVGFTPRGATIERYVRNRWTRNGRRPELIVLHASPAHRPIAVDDLDGLSRLLDDPGGGGSVHVANDAAGNDARFVSDLDRAFAVPAYDVIALHLEQLVSAKDGWHHTQLENTASWLVSWHLTWGIPLVFSTHSGVCQHADLDPAARDCGPDYPFGYVLKLAREATAAGASSTAEASSPAESGPPMPPSPAFGSITPFIAEYPSGAIEAVAAEEEDWLRVQTTRAP